MTERVIHELEVIEVNEQNRDLRAVRSVARELMFELFEQDAAGGKSGERVVRRFVHQLRDQTAQAFDFRTVGCE